MATKPRASLDSYAVKTALASSLVNPVVQRGSLVCAVRLTWSGQAVIEDEVWRGIIEARQHLDHIVSSVSGVQMFVSAVTATASSAVRGGQRIAPAVAYWVVSDPALFTEANFYTLLRQVTAERFGAQLKLVIQRKELPLVEQFLFTLSLIVKDYKDGYVRNKVDSLGGDNAHAHPLIKIYLRDKGYRCVIAPEKSSLASVGFMASFEEF